MFLAMTDAVFLDNIHVMMMEKKNISKKNSMIHLEWSRMYASGHEMTILGIVGHAETITGRARAL